MSLGEISVTASAIVESANFFGSAQNDSLVGGGVTDVGIITMNEIVNWVSTVDGFWSDGDNWDATLPPGVGKNVVIDMPDQDIIVTHNADAPDDGPLANLLCNEHLRLSFSELSVSGIFEMNNTLDLVSSQLIDTTVDLGPMGLVNVLFNSEFEGVTINGDLDLVANSATVFIREGLTVNGDVRIAGSTVTAGSHMLFEGPNKFIDGQATLSFVSNPSGADIRQSDIGNLLINSNVTIRGATGRIGQANAPLTLDGLVHSDLTGTIEIRGLGWVNNGTMRVSGTGSILLLNNSWTNHGVIEASDGGRLVLDGTYQNLGTLTAIDAEVRLDGEFIVADLGTFDFDNSLVVIEGTLDNTAGLVLDADQFNWKLGKGTVLGGTISSADGTALDVVSGPGNPTLDGVTLDADMNLIDGIKFVHIRNGLILNGVIAMAAVSQSATALVHVFGPNRTIEGTGTIEFRNTKGNVVIPDGLGGAGDLGILTIGSGITIIGASGVVGGKGIIFPASLINEGTIHSDRPGTITVQGTNWINNGVVQSSGGGGFTTFNSWINNGVLSLGPGPFFDSRVDFTQSATGTFEVGVRNEMDDGNGLMLVTGTATLDGVLRIEFEDVFNPAAGQQFTVLGYGARIGEFSSIEAPGLDPNLHIVATYTEGFLTLSIQMN